MLTGVGFCALARLPETILCPYSQCFVAGQHSAVRDLSAIHAPNDNNVCVPRAYGQHSIHVQTIITFVFREHTVTSSSMPNHSNVHVSRASTHRSILARTIIINVRVSRASAHQSIHAQTIITFVFREHPLTRASMSKP